MTYLIVQINLIVGVNIFWICIWTKLYWKICTRNKLGTVRSSCNYTLLSTSYTSDSHLCIL